MDFKTIKQLRLENSLPDTEVEQLDEISNYDQVVTYYRHLGLDPYKLRGVMGAKLRSRIKNSPAFKAWLQLRMHHRESVDFEKSLVETIASRSSNTFSVDLAKVEISKEIKHYGQVLSAGFDSLVNARANSLKFFSGTIKYVIALLLELPKFKPYSYQMNIDGKIRKFEAMMVIVVGRACCLRSQRSLVSGGSKPHASLDLCNNR